jgi:hypothetical protein
MRKYMPVIVLLALAAFLLGCVEQEPAEISVICKLSGVPQGCTDQLWNAKGHQIADAATDNNGVVYFKNVVPGKYTIKFVDGNGEYYPAEATVSVSSAESLPVKVELSEAPTAAPAGS